MKLKDIVIYQAGENPIDFEENLFKVKVTVAKILRKICKNKDPRGQLPKFTSNLYETFRYCLILSMKEPL